MKQVRKFKWIPFAKKPCRMTKYSVESQVLLLKRKKINFFAFAPSLQYIIVAILFIMHFASSKRKAKSILHEKVSLLWLTDIGVALRGTIELANPLHAEAVLELAPDLWLESVAETHADSVLLVYRFQRLGQQVPAYLTNVLSYLKLLTITEIKQTALWYQTMNLQS